MDWTFFSVLLVEKLRLEAAFSLSNLAAIGVLHNAKNALGITLVIAGLSGFTHLPAVFAGAGNAAPGTCRGLRRSF
ncbi:MAG TPA: hypothetical protein VFY24_11630 [Azospira sp.]|nr:hypothetical protein [Azospira sp.]